MDATSKRWWFTPLAAALLVNAGAVIAGCPGVSPHDGVGGFGGRSLVSSSQTVATSSVASSGTGGSSATSMTVGVSSAASSMSAVSSSSTASGSADAGACVGTCAASVALPWVGPVLAFIGKGPAPACPMGEAAIVDGGLGVDGGIDAPDESCTCLCASPTTITCLTTATAYPAGCSIKECGSTLLDPTMCTPLSTNACGATMPSIGLTAKLPPDAGACVPQQVKPPILPATWDTTVLICDPSVHGCSSGVCLPAAPPSFEVCIYQDGAATCPSTTYPKQFTVFRDILDDRSCTSCTCGNADAPCLGGKAIVSPFSGCPADGGLSDIPSCVPPNTSGQGSYFAEVVIEPTAIPTCPADGGTPTGGAAGDKLVTVCCM